MLQIGDLVHWHDPNVDDYSENEYEEQCSREFEIYEIINDFGVDVYYLRDDYGEVEAYEEEIELI